MLDISNSGCFIEKYIAIGVFKNSEKLFEYLFIIANDHWLQILRDKWLKNF